MYHTGYSLGMDDTLSTLAQTEIGPDWQALLSQAAPETGDDPLVVARVIEAVRALNQLGPGTGRRWLREWGEKSPAWDTE